MKKSFITSGPGQMNRLLFEFFISNVLSSVRSVIIGVISFVYFCIYNKLKANR